MNGESCDGKKEDTAGQCTLRSEHLFCSIFGISATKSRKSLIVRTGMNSR